MRKFRGGIRHDVWAKLWGNMSMNPLSALTRCGTAKMLANAEVRDLCVRMMEEMQLCAQQLRLEPAASRRRSALALRQRLGDFKTSMLADLEAGRPLELDPQLGAVVEIARRLDDSDALYACGSRADAADQSAGDV